MSRIVFVNRFFFPDHSATSQLLSDLAFSCAAAGHEVQVIAGRKAYGSAQKTLSPHEVVKGVRIDRVGSRRQWASGLAGRALDYVAFYAAAFFAMRRLGVAGSTIVVKTDPPLLSVVAAVALRGRRVTLVHWLQDVYPEVARELGIPLMRGPLGALLARMRDWSLRQAAMNVVVGQRMRSRIVGLGVEPEKTRVIANWIDETAIAPVPRASNPLRAAWGLDRSFVVGYSGNLGRAHEAQTLLEAAVRLKHRAGLCFLFIGGGFNLARLKSEAQARGVAALFQFQPYQSETQLSQSLSAPDAHWISLRPELEGLIVPSKVYGIAAVGRPIIAVVDAKGEVADLVRRYDCGVQVQPGDVEALVAVIQSLIDAPAQAQVWGDNARAMLDRDFSRRAALKDWADVLEGVDDPPDHP